MTWFKKSSVDGKVDGPIDMIKETDAVSRPMAIVVVIMIILLTASVVFCLFVGGRWVYNQFKPNKNTSAPAATDKPDNSSPASQPATAPASGDSNKPATNTNNSTNSSPKPATVPSSGPSQLPNSGPDPTLP